VRRAAVLLALAAAGCGDLTGAGDPDAPVAVRLPEKVCAQAAQELTKLAASGLQLGNKGEARLEEAAWLVLPQAQRDQILQLLAYDAACAAPEPSLEQTATVRSETNRVLAQQVVTTTADPGMLMGE
jgi:hypothetical protein